ncbi:MAG TPA: hypothetical protein V6D31_04385 [Candidatus Sericytochromatia bacterium]
MKLDTYKSPISVQAYSPKAMLFPSCALYWSNEQKYEASTWVQLLNPPHPFSYDEALLLCQQSEDEWIAWIPEHGEIVLRTSQFCIAT